MKNFVDIFPNETSIADENYILKEKEFSKICPKGI
jgi:hypothetical protein